MVLQAVCGDSQRLPLPLDEKALGDSIVPFVELTECLSRGMTEWSETLRLSRLSTA